MRWRMFILLLLSLFLTHETHITFTYMLLHTNTELRKQQDARYGLHLLYFSEISSY